MANIFKTTLDAINLSKNPEQFFSNKEKKYGQVFPLYLPNAPTTIFSGTPKAAQILFQAPPKIFSPSPLNPISPLVGANSLILQGGEKHQEDKKLMMPYFHGGALNEYQEDIYTIITEELLQLKFDSEQKFLMESVREITLHVIMGVIFGVKNRLERIRLRHHINNYIDSYNAVLMFFPSTRKKFLGFGPWDRFLKTQSILDEEIKNLILNSSNEISLMAKLKKLYAHEINTKNYRPIIDQLKTLLIAGHETTAVTLFWGVYYLSQDKKILNELTERIGKKSYKDLLSDPLLEAICNESMRIHPSVPIILRTLVDDFEFMDKKMLKGENIGLALTLLHRDPTIYQIPNQFNPGRFMDRKYEAHQFAPFGGSNRKCIGSSFGYLEMKLFFISLLQNANFEIYPQGKIRPIIKGLVMGPSQDIPIRFIF